LSVVFWKTQY